jgi:L-threonylcarbamoyladenylate synthase
MIRLAIDPVAPDRSLIQRAADAIRQGGIVAFPTDTLYGLAVDPRAPAAVEALFRLKGRDTASPMPLVAASEEQVERSVGHLAGLSGRLAREFWPGPLTLIIDAWPGLADALHSSDGRVAVRVPAHQTACLLASLVGHPVTSTSANRSGEPAPALPDDVAAALGSIVDVLLDAGPAPGGPPSTVVDASRAEIRLVRPGAVPWNRVLESLAGE